MNAVRKRDWTSFWIIAGSLTVLLCVGFGIAIEILKFAALVKWVFS